MKKFLYANEILFIMTARTVLQFPFRLAKRNAEKEDVEKGTYFRTILISMASIFSF